jgi:hypothetical protein
VEKGLWSMDQTVDIQFAPMNSFDARTIPALDTAPRTAHEDPEGSVVANQIRHCLAIQCTENSEIRVAWGIFRS